MSNDLLAISRLPFNAIFEDRCGRAFNASLGARRIHTRLVTNRSILARGLRVTHRAACELISAGLSTTSRAIFLKDAHCPT